MNVLVACEESQRVCSAFRERGHDAFSCDILDPSGGHPEWHIKGDAISLLKGGEFQTMDGKQHYHLWDLLIAHPPCTYLTNGGRVRMIRKETREYPPYGTFQMVNLERLKLGMEARDFFMAFLNAPVEHIAVENPTPMSFYALPEYTQAIQPYMFGDPYTKRTCLWLKNLPKLEPTAIIEERRPWINGGGGRMDSPNYKGQKFANSSKERSKTFPGIAKAMAEQWG